MSRFDEVRVAYTDDHERRALVGRSMTRHDLAAEQYSTSPPYPFGPLGEQLEREGAYDLPKPTLSRLGDPIVARGVPVVGMHGGLGGAIRGTRPHVDGIPKEAA